MKKVKSSSSYSVLEAKTNLSRLLKQVEAGEDVVISRGATPVARLIPAGITPHFERIPGLLRGLLKISPDFHKHEDWDAFLS